jgi:hypothetical protein
MLYGKCLKGWRVKVMSMDKFLAGKKKLDSINNEDYSTLVDGGTFEERHKRVTLYLELPLYDKIQSLRMQRKITNVTHFVNDALNFFLEKNPL